jgi:hypothetical protein
MHSLHDADQARISRFDDFIVYLVCITLRARKARTMGAIFIKLGRAPAIRNTFIDPSFGGLRVSELTLGKPCPSIVYSDVMKSTILNN